MLAPGSCHPLPGGPPPSKEWALAGWLWGGPVLRLSPRPSGKPSSPRQGFHSLFCSNQVFNSWDTNKNMWWREPHKAGFDEAGMKTGQLALRSNLAPPQSLTFFKSNLFFFFKTMTILLALGLSGPAASATRQMCTTHCWRVPLLKPQQPGSPGGNPPPTTGTGGVLPQRPLWVGRQLCSLFLLIKLNLWSKQFSTSLRSDQTKGVWQRQIWPTLKMNWVI